MSLRTYPIDVTGHFHFINETRWKPYVGLGARYVGAPDLSAEELAVIGHPYSDHLDAEVIGGLGFLVTPSFAITVELKSLVRNREDYNPLLKVSGGLGWRF